MALRFRKMKKLGDSLSPQTGAFPYRILRAHVPFAYPTEARNARLMKAGHEGANRAGFRTARAGEGRQSADKGRM
jgi:hypothetical protein